MYANDPEMAKKWEKEESIRAKLQNLIKQEIKSINEGFDKYHLGGLLDSKLKKRLERAIKIWGGKVDAVGDDYIKFRLGSFEVKKFPALLKKLDRNKNVWIGDKRKNNIWDRRRNIDKLNKEATTTSAVPPYATPKAFSKSTQNAIDIDDEDDEKSESMAAPFRRRKSRGLGRPMKVGLNERKLSSHQKKAILIAIEMSGNMTGATKKIERIKKGLSNDKKVKDALRLANESINEGKWSKIMRSVRKGSKSGPWSIVVYDKRKRKVKHQRLVKILQQIPAHYEDVKKKYPRDSIGIEDKYGERVYTESINEAVEPKDNMAKIQKIVKRKQATKLNGIMIDMQSANLLMKLWDAVSDKDKEKMNKLNAKVLTIIIKKLWSRVNLKLPI